MSSNTVSYAQKRRSSRLEKAISLAVQGVDASRAPFREDVTTVAISCHGCSCQMRHEVLPGSMLVLDMGQGANGYADWPARARVKWIQKLDNAADPAYGIAVEFESAGNIWGIPSPPEDWLPAREVKNTARPNPASNAGRELRFVARTEPQTVSERSAGAPTVSLVKKSEAPTSLSPWFSDLMAGISNQIQVTVSEIAAATLANERNRLLDEFRLQLQREAAGTIERVIETSKDELAQRALKVLNEATEATVRKSHERFIGSIEQNIEDARQRMVIQENQLNERVDGMASRTTEQLQRTLEASRTEAAARFVSRMREQVAPVLEEAKSDLQKLVASQIVFKEESQALYARVTSELESGVNAKLVQAHEVLDKQSAAVLADCNDKLVELSQTYETVARDGIQTLIASATDGAKKDLEQRAAEISGNFTDHLEGHVRNYLEFIGESIAEFPKKTSAS
jgi:hypothetical protein